MDKRVVLTSDGSKLCTLSTRAERSQKRQSAERKREMIVYSLYWFALLLLIMVGAPMINIYLLH